MKNCATQKRYVRSFSFWPQTTGDVAQPLRTVVISNRDSPGGQMNALDEGLATYAESRILAGKTAPQWALRVSPATRTLRIWDCSR